MNENKVEYDYDYNEDSLFIYCVNPYNYDVSLELDNNVILDIDTEGKPVAFEFLNASKVFGLSKTYFKKLVGMDIHLEITEEKISLKTELHVMIHNRNQSFDVARITTNLNNIPSIETELITA